MISGNEIIMAATRMSVAQRLLNGQNVKEMHKGTVHYYWFLLTKHLLEMVPALVCHSPHLN